MVACFFCGVLFVGDQAGFVAIATDFAGFTDGKIVSSRVRAGLDYSDIFIFPSLANIGPLHPPQAHPPQNTHPYHKESLLA